MQDLFAKRWFVGLLWGVAVVGTVLLAGYQRRTGPSYPVDLRVELAGENVELSLPRSHPGDGGPRIEIPTAAAEISGEVVWRRWPTQEPWQSIPLLPEDGMLAAELPHHPPAGKVEYILRVREGATTRVLPGEESVVLRFRGAVPLWVLIPHILCMFLALVVMFRALLGTAMGERDVRKFIPRVLVLLVPGGLVLGPIVQKLAFGAFWTGWPFGEDWTDNKTLASVLAWVLAWLICRRWPRLQRLAVVGAAAVMIAIYLIPHSTHGSELDWSQLEAEAPTQEP